MIDIYNISLLDILPDSLKNDKDMVAMAKAFTPELQSLSQETKLCMLLKMIDHLSSELVDHLAWEMLVDFYDQTLPLESRRELVKTAIGAHRYKGTPWAIEQVASIVFKNSSVREWFEYGGEPHHFRIETEQLVFAPGDLAKFRRLVEGVKRKSSWFDDIVFKIIASTIRVDISTKSFIVDYFVCNTFYPNEIVVNAPSLPVFVAPGMPMFTATE
ncbi:phage tail protein I [Brevibacillus brevis]|nr:phage tail protein I [Brevibacillus brevis]